MNEQEAIQVIKEACANVSANLAVHQKIQQAIAVIEDKVDPKVVDPKK